MTPDSFSPRISLLGPSALAAALPYLLDEPLHGDIVVAHIEPDGSLAAIRSLPIPPAPVAASEEVLRQWAGDIGRDLSDGLSVRGQRPDERFAVALYLPSGVDTPPAWFGAEVMGDERVWPVGMVDAIVVFGDRWRSLVCRDEGCCPATGSRIMDNSDATLVAAQLVAAGFRSNRPDAPATSPERAAVAAALAGFPYPHTLTARRALLRKAWREARNAPAVPAPQELARLALAADRPGVRDALLVRMARAGLRDGRFWQRQLRLWEQVEAAVPEDYAPGAATMIAITAWSMRDGGGAVLAVDRALSLQPAHRMASLVRALVLQGTSADEWLRRLLTIDESDCLRFDRPPGDGIGEWPEAG